MKKLFLIAVMMLTGMGLQAQNTTIYPRLGVNFSKIDDKVYTSEMDDHYIKPSYKVGLTAGFEVEQLLANNFGASLGLLYSWQGNRWPKYEEMPGNTIHLHYLNIPIMLIGYVGNTGLSLKAGFQVGWLLAARSQGVNVKSNYRDIDLSIPIGICYEFNRFCIDLRYHIGISKPYQDLPNVEMPKTHTKCFQLTLGYAI